MLRYIAPLVVFAALVLLFVRGLDPERDLNELPSPFLGKPAPAFDLPRLKMPEQRVSNRSYAGETTLVNVWATWCVGCREEHDFLLELQAKKEIPIYGINWRDRRDDALSWLAQLGDPYVASGYDADGRVGIDWGVYGAPETFLISEDGRVIHKHLGPLNRAIWERDFTPLLNPDQGGAR